jgi:hypothetical protein
MISRFIPHSLKRLQSGVMCRTVAILVVLASALSAMPAAQSQPVVRTVAKVVPMDIFEIVDYSLQCPAGYVPIQYSVTPQYPYDINEEQSRNLIDGNGASMNRNALSSAAQLDGGGFALSVFNIEHHAKILEAIVVCLAAKASTDNTLQLVKTTSSVPRAATGSAISFCPPDSPVALAGFSNADGRLLIDAGSAPVWGTSVGPILLADLADGTTGPPTGWRMQVFNNIAPNPSEIAAYAVCGKASGLQTYIYSAPVPPGAFGSRTPFSVFAPVPDGWTAVGTGFDVGSNGQFLHLDLWMQDGNIIDVLQWFSTATGYDSAVEVRAFVIRGGGGFDATPSRAVAAVLAMPQSAAPPPPSAVTIVEFYNSGLDHYFITAIPDEIAKLDDGTFRGWARTGQTFNAYGVGSTGRTGRRPVCREYGLPIYALDSHFYSASPDECMATLANTGGAWGLEASEVFQMDLPDAATGACPDGGIPVYRVWNQRRDSNHRYTTSVAIRDQMVARGGVAEGYGPNAVALCGLP